jgi:glycosidase
MRRILLIVLVLGFCLPSLYAQKAKNRSYLGLLSVGPSIPLGYYGAEGGDRGGNATRGIQINLLNAGIMITERIGIAANVIVGQNGINTSVNGASFFDPWSYGLISVGPMFVFPTSDRSFLDIKPMIGYGRLSALSITHSAFSGNDAAFVLSTTYRYILHRRISLLVNADFITMDIRSTEVRATQEFASLSLNVGLGFNF